MSEVECVLVVGLWGSFKWLFDTDTTIFSPDSPPPPSHHGAASSHLCIYVPLHNICGW